MQSLAKPQRPVVGVMSGLPINGGFDMQTRQPSQPWMVMEEIRQLFQIESVKPSVDQIPDKVSVLLLVHPKNLPQQTRYAIDQFVLRGGKLLVFVDPTAKPTTACRCPARWAARTGLRPSRAVQGLGPGDGARQGGG